MEVTKKLKKKENKIIGNNLVGSARQGIRDTLAIVC